jgi:hypothetical protein
MVKGKAFFVVGHKNWGKSETLTALTNGNYHIRNWDIRGESFFVRRMSDDDRPKDMKRSPMHSIPKILLRFWQRCAQD